MITLVPLAMNMIRRIDYDCDIGTLLQSLLDEINKRKEVAKQEW